MADNKLLNSPEDPKAARAKLKADQKEYKKTLKEQRYVLKKNKKVVGQGERMYLCDVYLLR